MADTVKLEAARQPKWIERHAEALSRISQENYRP
jgi:hypothetical protein